MSTPNAAVRWWPNWYVTRLHAVVSVHPSGIATAACKSTGLRSPQHYLMQSDWQRRRLAADVPKCKHCLRALSGSPVPGESDAE